MAKSRKGAAPESPWRDGGEEVVEPGIGLGFVTFEKYGEHLRGKLLRRWRSQRMKSPAVTIELTERPGVGVFDTANGSAPKRIEPGPGDKVNLSLTHDLERKLTPDLEGEEVGIQYTEDRPTPKGSMRVFRVVHFGQQSF